MLNQNKYIRKAIIQALSPIPVFSNFVPKSIDTPDRYVLITSMGKQEFARAKNCYEWQVSFNLDVFRVGTLGYDFSTDVDDMCEVIIPAIKELVSEEVQIKNVYLEFENDLSFDSTTNSINRRVLTYSVWCNYQEI